MRGYKYVCICICMFAYMQAWRWWAWYGIIWNDSCGLQDILASNFRRYLYMNTCTESDRHCVMLWMLGAEAGENVQRWDTLAGLRPSSKKSTHTTQTHTHTNEHYLALCTHGHMIAGISVVSAHLRTNTRTRSCTRERGCWQRHVYLCVCLFIASLCVFL